MALKNSIQLLMESSKSKTYVCIVKGNKSQTEATSWSSSLNSIENEHQATTSAISYCTGRKINKL